MLRFEDLLQKYAATRAPSQLPTTSSPTAAPTAPSLAPTREPTTPAPTTRSPTRSPTTRGPTAAPAPPTKLPSPSPTKLPTTSPTKSPTVSPTPRLPGSCATPYLGSDVDATSCANTMPGEVCTVLCAALFAGSAAVFECVSEAAGFLGENPECALIPVDTETQVVQSSLLITGINSTDNATQLMLQTTLASVLNVDLNDVVVTQLSNTVVAIFNPGGRRLHAAEALALAPAVASAVPQAPRLLGATSMMVTEVAVEADFEVRVPREDEQAWPGGDGHVSITSVSSGETAASYLVGRLDALRLEPSLLETALDEAGLPPMPDNISLPWGRLRLTKPLLKSVETRLVAGPWGPCGDADAMCATTLPLRHRAILCAEARNVSTIVDSSLCRSQAALSTSEPCPPGEAQPPPCGWSSGDWSRCDALDGSECLYGSVGERTRGVWCLGEPGQEDCSAVQPAVRAACRCPLGSSANIDDTDGKQDNDTAAADESSSAPSMLFVGAGILVCVVFLAVIACCVRRAVVAAKKVKKASKVSPAISITPGLRLRSNKMPDSSVLVPSCPRAAFVPPLCADLTDDEGDCPAPLSGPSVASWSGFSSAAITPRTATSSASTAAMSSGMGGLRQAGLPKKQAAGGLQQAAVCYADVPGDLRRAAVAALEEEDVATDPACVGGLPSEEDECLFPKRRSNEIEFDFRLDVEKSPKGERTNAFLPIKAEYLDEETDKEDENEEVWPRDLEGLVNFIGHVPERQSRGHAEDRAALSIGGAARNGAELAKGVRQGDAGRVGAHEGALVDEEEFSVEALERCVAELGRALPRSLAELSVEELERCVSAELSAQLSLPCGAPGASGARGACGACGAGKKAESSAADTVTTGTTEVNWEEPLENLPDLSVEDFERSLAELDDAIPCVADGYVEDSPRGSADEAAELPLQELVFGEVERSVAEWCSEVADDTDASDDDPPSTLARTGTEFPVEELSLEDIERSVAELDVEFPPPLAEPSMEEIERNVSELFGDGFPLHHLRVGGGLEAGTRRINAAAAGFCADDKAEHPAEREGHKAPEEQEERKSGESERADCEKLERVERERVEGERLEYERVEIERLESERLERESLESERRECKRLERERLQRERLEIERLESEHLERVRLDAEFHRREDATKRLRDAAAAQSQEVLVASLEVARLAGVAAEELAKAERSLARLVEKESQAVARRVAAANRLAAALAASDSQMHTLLIGQIRELEMALAEARVEHVAPEIVTVAEARLASLRAQQLRAEALRNAEVALGACDVESARLAVAAARATGVESVALEDVEAGLAALEKDLVHAAVVERALRRCMELALAAFRRAEAAATASDIAALLGGATTAGVEHDLLQLALTNARGLRIFDGDILKEAEEMLPAVDLGRLLVARRLAEQTHACAVLASEVLRARAASQPTQGVLAELRRAIADATAYGAEADEAEAMLVALEAEYVAEARAARSRLEEALEQGDAEGIRSQLQRCRVLGLSDAISHALLCLRDLVATNITKTRAVHAREERLAMVAATATLVGILRASGDGDVRQFHNELQELKGALRVFCRVRPKNKKELAGGDGVAVSIQGLFNVAVQKTPQEHATFEYDRIFGPECSQSQVFDECRSLVQSAFDGYNVTIFTYGQTGAGKTWTLYGTAAEPGISPRTCQEVFRTVEREGHKFDFEVKASMVELYLNDLRDILLPKGSKDVPKLEFKSHRLPDGSVGTKLENVSEVVVATTEDLARLVAAGLGNRKVRSTKMNDDSSRSHLMLTISVLATDRAGGVGGSWPRLGKITIVDLAGSERLAKSGATGDAQREAIEINKSLTALGDVMMAFTSRAKQIPYRNHKLTQLMQDSLGGTAKTLMFVNVSPAASNADETINAMKYAARARCIENEVRSSAALPGRRSTCEAASTSAPLGRGR